MASGRIPSTEIIKTAGREFAFCAALDGLKRSGTKKVATLINVS